MMRVFRDQIWIPDGCVALRLKRLHGKCVKMCQATAWDFLWERAVGVLPCCVISNLWQKRTACDTRTHKPGSGGHLCDGLEMTTSWPKVVAVSPTKFNLGCCSLLIWDVACVFGLQDSRNSMEHMIQMCDQAINQVCYLHLSTVSFRTTRWRYRSSWTGSLPEMSFRPGTDCFLRRSSKNHFFSSKIC